MASSIPSQARAVDPFASYNSDSVNTLTRMLTYGEDGLATPRSLDVALDATSDTQVTLQPGFCYKDDVWLNIDTPHTVDFTDSEHYYMFDTGFDEAGYYYIVLEYTYQKSRPAPEAKVLIVKPSQTSAYTPGNSWIFLKAVLVEGVGPFNVNSVYNFDPLQPDNKRLYIATYAGTEIGLPIHIPERDQGRIVYGMEEDDFFFGLSDRWSSLGIASGASFEDDTTGFDIGDLVYLNPSGDLALALATLPSTTADGVVTKVGSDGIVQTSGKVTNVKIENGASVLTGNIVYLSETEAGSITSQKSDPFSQFVGRCVSVDGTAATVLFHRGEPTGTVGTEIGVSLPEVTLAAGGAWLSSGGSFYQDVDISGVKARNAVITVWDATTNMEVVPENIEFISDDVMRVWMPTDTVALGVFVLGPSATTISTAQLGKKTDFLDAGASWLSSGSLYYQELEVASLAGSISNVMLRDTSTNEVIMPSEIEFDSTSILRIWMPVNTQQLEAVAIGPCANHPPPQVLVAFTTQLVAGSEWVSSGGQYYQDIDLSLFISDRVVMEFYDTDTNMVMHPSVEFLSGQDTARVWMPDNTHQLNVTLIG